MEVLRTVGVSKRYADHLALDKVSISIPQQCIFGLLGPNGAGKTSLIRIITQITAADEGEIFFKGERLSAKHIGKIGYLPEERGLYKKMKVGEQLIYLSRLKGMPKNEVKSRLKYWFQKFDIVSWWDKTIEDLSKGMQQKIQFIATVLHEPELIILDEPFSGFDPINANIIKEEILMLRDKGCTIIFSTHRMESVEELCDHIALINKAEKVLDGKKADIKNQFKSNTFVVETNQPLVGFNAHFQVLESQQTGEALFKSKVKLFEGKANDLIRMLVDQVEIHSVQEHIPSINEIFIQTVGRENIDEPMKTQFSDQ